MEGRHRGVRLGHPAGIGRFDDWRELVGKLKDIDIMREQGLSFDEIADQLGTVREAIEGLYEGDVSVVDKSQNGMYNRSVESTLHEE
jgi:hypothetical protein